MSEPRPSVARFVRAIASHELASGGGDADRALVERITVRLHHALGKLIGDAGFDALFARSLVLARQTHPVLAGITLGSGGKLKGREVDPEGLYEGGLAVVAQFVELMVVLVGEDLAMRLVADVWPEVDEEQYQ